MASITKIKTIIDEKKLHPHDQPGTHHDFGYLCDGKSTIIHTDTRTNYMQKMLKRHEYFHFSDFYSVEDFDGEHEECKIFINTELCTIDPNHFGMNNFMLWIYSTPLDDRKECDYYLTDSLTFRYYPGKEQWRILPSESENMISFGDKWHKLLKFWNGGKVDYDWDERVGSGTMIALLIIQDAFLSFGSVYSLDNGANTAYKSVLKRCMKEQTVPELPRERMIKMVKKLKKDPPFMKTIKSFGKRVL